MFERIVQHEGNQFYSVKQGIISVVQEEMGIILPKELRAFYEEVGYGFLHSENYNFNRILSPQSLCDFRFRKGQFSDATDLELYEEYERDGIVFFEISEGSYLSIGFSQNNNGQIYYGKTQIANSLKEFLEKYQKNENYFD